MIKEIGKHIVTPIMLAVVLFTTGDNGTWDSLLAFLTISLYFLMGLVGLLYLVVAIAIALYRESFIDSIKDDEESKDGLLKLAKSNRKIWSRRAWYRWVYTVILAVASLAVFVHVGWTVTVIVYVIMSIIMYTGVFSLINIFNDVMDEAGITEESEPKAESLLTTLDEPK